MKRWIILFLLVAGLSAVPAKELEVGAKAPADLVGMNHNGKNVDLSKIFSKGLTLVFFYPKAMTPG